MRDVHKWGIPSIDVLFIEMEVKEGHGGTRMEYPKYRCTVHRNGRGGGIEMYYSKYRCTVYQNGRGGGTQMKYPKYRCTDH